VAPPLPVVTTAAVDGAPLVACVEPTAQQRLVVGQATPWSAWMPAGSATSVNVPTHGARGWDAVGVLLPVAWGDPDPHAAVATRATSASAGAHRRTVTTGPTWRIARQAPLIPLRPDP
jgi:hypothetical protein